MSDVAAWTLGVTGALGVVTAITGIVAVCISLRNSALGVAQTNLLSEQVKVMNAQFVQSQRDTLLLIEQDIAVRRAAFAQLPKSKIAEHHKSALENYLNAYDRLASFILRGALPMEEMRFDYRDVFRALVEELPEQLGPTSHYRHILKIFRLWEDGE